MRVQPRAGRDQLGGVRAGALQVRLGAAPVEGEANRALVRFLAQALDVAPSSIELRQGQSGRDKLLHVAGLQAVELRRRLAGD